MVKDFAAVITPGLHLAFQDKQRVSLEGLTLLGERANRKIWVCGPGAFIVLKALAFDRRGENKDAYDLYFLIRNYGVGINDISKCLAPLLQEEIAKEAIELLSRDFIEPDLVGPSRVSQFIFGGPDANLQADVVGFVRELLAELRSDQSKPLV